MHWVYLLRDNQTVAGEQDIVRDHDLVKRTTRRASSCRTPGGTVRACAPCIPMQARLRANVGKADTTMNMVLRPGEAIVWRWGQLTPLKYHGALMTMPTYPLPDLQRPVGVSPRFRAEMWRKGAKVDSITSGPMVWRPTMERRAR